MSKKDKRFITVHSEGGLGASVEVLVDKVTGVNYLFKQSGYAGGLTVLVDRDGKPLVTPVNTLPEY